MAASCCRVILLRWDRKVKNKSCHTFQIILCVLFLSFQNYFWAISNKIFINLWNVKSLWGMSIFLRHWRCIWSSWNSLYHPHLGPHLWAVLEETVTPTVYVFLSSKAAEGVTVYLSCMCLSWDTVKFYSGENS